MQKIEDVGSVVLNLIDKRAFLFGLLLTLSLLWPFVAAPYFTHHDDVQVIRLYELNKCIKDGQIPCRWVPDLGGAYGYPIFNYYAPLPYYFGEIFYLLTGSLLVSVKIMFATAFIGAYIFMYFLGKKLWGSLGGMLSAVFYSFAPYHAVVLYVRGAMGELWGLMFLPALIWAVLSLKQSLKIVHVLFLGIIIAWLILSHNLSSLMFLPVTLIFVAVVYMQDKNIRFLKLFLISLLLGLMLSAFYWIPMVAEKSLVHVDSTTSGYFGYTEHFKGLRKLFLDRSWGYGASVREVPGGEKDGMSFQIGWVHVLAWVISLYLAWKIKSEEKSYRKKIIILTLAAILSILMIHPRSESIWKIFTPLKYIQFPWRFLGLVSLFVSLLAGGIYSLPKKGRIVVFLFLLAVVLANFSYFKPQEFISISEGQLLSGQYWNYQIKRSIFDFLPVYAQQPPADIAKNRFTILTGDTEVLDYEEGTNWINFKTNTKNHSIIRLSQYYFPNWKVFIDGKETKIDYENSLGLITFILSTGIHQVEAKLFDTPIRSFANGTSIFGLIMLLLLIATQISVTRQWISYYIKALN